MRPKRREQGVILAEATQRIPLHTLYVQLMERFEVLPRSKMRLVTPAAAQ